MQDLIQNYVDVLNKLRDDFRNELTAQAQELSKAIGNYSRCSEAALSLFVEQVSARGVELEAAAAVRLNQFRGLPVNSSLSDVSDEPLPQAPTNADQAKIAATAERAIAESLHVESDGDGKPKFGRPMVLVKSDPAA